MVKNLPAVQEIGIPFLGQEDPLEEEMATYSIILAGKIPWNEDPSRVVKSHKELDMTKWLNTNTQRAIISFYRIYYEK